MKRRSLLALGAVSAAVLAVGGGTVAMMRPGLADARLTLSGREIFTAVGRAVLDGTMPAAGRQRQAALDGMLDRIDALVAALPPHAQAELSQLLALLSSAPGRRGLSGLALPWPEAGVSQVQESLQMMRVSTLSLRRQSYQALHDIVGGAYFSDSQTWAVLGYPGPLTL